MSLYKTFDWFLLRSAFFSHEEGQLLLQSPTNVTSSLEDPIIAKVISIAAPSFYKQFIENEKNGQQNKDLVAALFNILSRMTFRSIPFSCYAGVSLGHIRPEPTTLEEIFFVEKEKYLISIKKIIQENYNIKIILNPTTVFENETVKFIKEIIEKDLKGNTKRSYQYSYVSIPQVLIIKLKNNPNKLSTKLKEYLLNLQILWPEISNKELANEKVEFYDLGQKNKTKLEMSSLNQKVEMYKPCQRANLSTKTSDALLKGAEVIMTLFRPEINILEQIKNDFLKKYESQEVLLTEILTPDTTIGKKFLLLLESDTKFQKTNNVEELLIELILNPIVQKSGILNLDNSHIEKIIQLRKLNKIKNLCPDSFSVVSEIVSLNGNEKKHYLKYLNGPHSIGHFARYLSLNNELATKVKELTCGDQNLHPNAIMAEVIHKADRLEMSNVMPQTNLYQAVIPLSAQNSNNEKLEIQLKDLVVFFNNGKFKLKSKKLGREIIPVLSNLYSFQIDSHPIYQFLGYLEMQNSFAGLSWNWGGLSKLLHLPRVVYKNIILTPARWRLTIAMVKPLLQDDIALGEIRIILKNYNFPDVFELLEKPSIFLRFDLNNDQSLTSLQNILKKNKNHLFQEIFEPQLVNGPEGKYSHDVIIPFIKKNVENEKLLNPTEVKQKDRVFPPGSNWTYLDLYMPRNQVNIFLTKHLKKLIKKSNNCWFYLQYYDPDFHIRLRGQGDSLELLTAFGQKLVNKQICSHFNIKTYNREIERYGGVKGCELFEVISQFDSEATIEIAEVLEKSKLSRIEIWILAAIISTKTYINSFECSEDEALGFVIQGSKIKPDKLQNGLIKKIFNKFKDNELAGNTEYSTEYCKILDIYKKRLEKQKNAFNKLHKLFGHDKIFTTKKSYFKSLVHLSLVRLDIDFDKEYEFFVFKTLEEIFLIKGANL